MKTRVAVQWALYVRFGRHSCSGVHASNAVICTSGPDHSGDSFEII